MKSISCYIVEIAERYNNTKKVGDIELVVNMDVDEAQFVNRVGILKAVPANYTGEMEVGMKVIVHHNIARITNNLAGQKENPYLIMDDLYRVPFDLLFLYEKDGEWKAHGDYCFVKPIEAEKVEKIGSIIIPETAQDKYKALQGEMFISNPKLDVSKGEKIIFKPNSEHEYEINGEKLYKINIERILCRIVA